MPVMSARATTVTKPAELGERPLVEALYVAEATALTRSHRGRSGSDDAVDLVHDAFVRLLALGTDRLGALAGERPAAYLWRVALNLGRDRAKTGARRGAAAHVTIDDVELAGPDPIRQLEARDELRRVELAVLAMRPRTRAIFLAHRVDGMGYAEIAERCGIGVKGVEKQMGRAIAILAREMDCGDRG